MGKVIMRIKVTNNIDVEKAKQGLLVPDAVRSQEIDALFDTGATMLTLPGDLVAALGLPIRGKRKVRYADGRVAEIEWVSSVELEILGREMTCDALVEPNAAHALVGQIPLEALDLIVDPKSGEARVNPESPDAPLLDLLAAAV